MFQESSRSIQRPVRAAVDLNYRAGQVTRALGTDKGHDRCKLRGIADAFHWGRSSPASVDLFDAHAFLLGDLRREILQSLGQVIAGTHGGNGYSLGRDLLRGALPETQHAGASRVRENQVFNWLLGSD